MLSASQSFCDFSESSSSDSTSIISRDHSLQVSFSESGLASGPVPPRINVDWPNTPPLSLSLRFSGLFNEAELAEIEADTTRYTHRSRSPNFDLTYDVQSFPPIKDINLDLSADSDISDLYVMSQKLPHTLSTIPEAVEPSPVLAYTTSLSDFDVLTTASSPDSEVVVSICQRKKTGKMYKIRSRRIYDHLPWTEQDILETLRDLGAPFLPHLKSTFKEESQIHLVLDHYPSSSLRELITKYGPLGSQRVLFYASELLTAISNLHAIGIMHRNLNPDDILLDERGHIMVTNFEFAGFFSTSRGCTLFAQDSSPVPPFQGYQAPEIVLGWSHDLAVDCWGFGMLLYFMYFGKHPFQEDRQPVDQQTLRGRIVQGPFSPESLQLVHPQTRDIILKCLERNPHLRLTMDGIKNHAWFAKVPWRKVAEKLIEVPSLPGLFENSPGRSFLWASPLSGLRQPTSFTRGGLPMSSPSPALLPSLPRAARPSLSPRPSFPLSPSTSALAESCISDGVEVNLSLQSPKARTFRPFLGPQTEAQSSKGQGPHGVEIWDLLDQEDRDSTYTAERSKILSFFRARKLRKQSSRSSLLGKSFFLNLSTTSISQKLRTRKSRSTTNFHKDSRLGDGNLAMVGVEHIGSGIGYTVPNNKRASVETTTPRSCHGGFFGGRFTLGLGAPRTIGTTSHQPASLRMYPSVEVSSGGPCSGLQSSLRSSGAAGRASTDGIATLSPKWPQEANFSPPLLISGTANRSRSSLSQAGTGNSPPLSLSPRSGGGPFTPTTEACAEDCRQCNRDDDFKEVEARSALRIVGEGRAFGDDDDDDYATGVRLITPRITDISVSSSVF